MDRYGLTRAEAAAFLGVSQPTLSNWVTAGLIQASRKDPTKKKSPYIFTRQACIAALNNPIHTVTVSEGDMQEGRKCQSSEEVKFGTPASRCRVAQELHDRRKSDLWRIDKLGEAPKVTFDEACLRWLEEKAHKKSLDDDKSRITFWLNHFEGMLLRDITETKIYLAVSKMTNRRHEENYRLSAESLRRKGKEPPKFAPKVASVATKATHLAFIKSLLRTAELDWKWLEKAPAIKVPQPKNKRIRWLEMDEAKRLICECPEPLKSVVSFALATGLRRSNIINLEWQQIDMQRKVAWVNPEESKSGRAIGVALNDTACKVLRDQIGRHGKWVFVYTEQSTRPDGTKTASVRKMRYDANTAWRAALKRAGIEDFRFHDLRHTWASWLVQAGVPISVLQEMGGWESIEMVRRYAHLAPNHLTEHAKQIDLLFGGSVPNMSHIENMEGTNNS